ncbi:hypothetical protein JCM19238_4629 [Vibrio ponticus]|nr:hypothetical protein JCM19238_4629 [Vibrio ponticus]
MDITVLQLSQHAIEFCAYLPPLPSAICQEQQFVQRGSMRKTIGKQQTK